MVISSAARVGLDLFPLPLREIRVYVHIPFCSSRCSYCDFYFETGRSPRVMSAILDRIVEEAEYFLRVMGFPRVRSVYFGGGTPSVIPPPLLERFLGRLRRALFAGALQAGDAAHGEGSSVPEDAQEWTFEANPESIGPELLAVLSGAGISRISLGVQSFRDDLLRSLTRRADRRSVVRAMTLLGEPAFKQKVPHLNIDLITGIPGQSRAMVDADVASALEFVPDHFSVYSLTIEEHTPLKQAVARGSVRFPKSGRADLLWLSARDKLVAAGYEWYEISNFALPDCRSLHNSAYWRLEPYLGLGPGAVSTLPMSFTGPGRRDPSSGAVRLTNPNLFVYGSRFEQSWHHAVEHLSARDLLLEQFMVGLRTSDGVSLDRIRSVFSLDLLGQHGALVEEWRTRRLIDDAAVAEPQGRLVLRPKARLLLDTHLIEVGAWIDSLLDPIMLRWP